MLSRLSVELDKIPAIYEDFVVETWIDSVMRYFTNRNFKITNKMDMCMDTEKAFGQ